MIFSKVIKNEILNGKFHRLEFAAQNRGFKFCPGQFVILKVPGGVFRDYSIASLPETLPCWVDVSPDGPGCQYLKNLKPGAKVETSLPTGTFVLNPGFENYLLGATGSGVASILPLAWELSVLKKRIFFYWGLRFSEDICLENKVKSLGGEIILSRPDKNWTGKTGHVTEYMAGLVKTLPPAKTCSYLCGNKNMLADVKAILKKARLPGKQIFFENYFL